MPSRIISFVNGEIYHIYNRGVEKRHIFESRRDQARLLETLIYYQQEGPKPKFSNYFKYKIYQPNTNKKIAEILAFCLMPNHFHLIIKQTKEGGITEFLSKLSNSYTKYYNTKYKRIGPLLQGEFKAILVESNEQLLHLSRYIHLNPLIANLTKSLDNYEWSSYHEYVHGKAGICDKDAILNQFKSPQDYQQFVLDHSDYAKQLNLIKHQTLE